MLVVMWLVGCSSPGSPDTDGGSQRADGAALDAATALDATTLDATTLDATTRDASAEDASVAADAGIVDEPDAGPPTYRNVVLDQNGDPFCARFGDAYYLYLPSQVSGGGRVRGFTSTDLVHWTALGVVYDNVDVAYGGQRSIGLWAPEVFAHEGRYYLYYAGLMSDPLDERVGDKDIVVVESADPTNFYGGTRTVLLDNRYAFIDPSVFQDPVTGELYLLNKRRGAAGGGTEIQIRTMASPTELSSGPTRLAHSDDFPNSDHTVEQPMMWREGGLYYLLFSLGHGGQTNYRIGYSTSRSPTGTFTYRGVLFGSDLEGELRRRIISPGASSIVLDGAGQPWMVYRQKTTMEDTFADRGVCIDPIAIDPSTRSMRGTPTRGVARPAPVPLP